MVRMVDPKVLKQYPLARLIPDMRDSEWKDFCAGIAVRAVKVPLEASDDDTVLGGRHLLRSAAGARMVKAAVEAGERKSGRSASVARVGPNLASPQTSARRRAEVWSVRVPCFLFPSFHSAAIAARWSSLKCRGSTAALTMYSSGLSPFRGADTNGAHQPGSPNSNGV